MAPIGRVGLIPFQPCTRRTQTSQPPSWLDSTRRKVVAVANHCADVRCSHVELPTWDAVVSMPHPSKNRVSIEVDNNTSPTPMRRCSRPRHYGHLWTRMREPWCCLRVVLWQKSHSTAFPQVTRLERTPKSSAHCCSFTGRRALFRVFWVVEVSRWRWPLHESGERVEQGFQPT